MTQFNLPYDTILDTNGDPINGGKVNFYEAGTSTPLNTYSDDDLSSANANPVVADASGRIGPIYLLPQPYKVVTTDASDNVIDTTDNYRAHIPNGEQILYASTVGGTGDVITITLDPAVTAYRQGMRITFKASAANTGATTLNVNGVSADAVTDPEGNALVAGEIAGSSSYYEVIRTATDWQLVNPTSVEVYGNWELAAAIQNASASATIDFTALSSSYDEFRLVISGCVPATDDTSIVLVVGTGATPTYQTGADYSYARTRNLDAGTAVDDGGTGATSVPLNPNGAGVGIGNAAGEHINAEITFSDPASATLHKQFRFFVDYRAAGATTQMVSGIGTYVSTTAVTAIRVSAASGNITSGRFTLLGRNKA